MSEAGEPEIEFLTGLRGFGAFYGIICMGSHIFFMCDNYGGFRAAGRESLEMLLVLSAFLNSRKFFTLFQQNFPQTILYWKSYYIKRGLSLLPLYILGLIVNYVFDVANITQNAVDLGHYQNVDKVFLSNVMYALDAHITLSAVLPLILTGVVHLENYFKYSPKFLYILSATFLGGGLLLTGTGAANAVTAQAFLPGILAAYVSARTDLENLLDKQRKFLISTLDNLLYFAFFVSFQPFAIAFVRLTKIWPRGSIPEADDFLLMPDFLRSNVFAFIILLSVSAQKKFEFCRMLEWNFLWLIGTHSLPIYLLQHAVGSRFYLNLKQSSTNFLQCMAITVILSYCVNHFIQQPLKRWAERRFCTATNRTAANL